MRGAGDKESLSAMKTCRLVNATFSTAVLAAVLVAVGGCHAPGDWKFADLYNLDKGLPWTDDKPKPGIPARVVGTWTDTVLRREGQTPQRGFGGRLFFYGRNSNDPILVDGQLVVYAFDENGREPTDNRPTRRYVFPPEQIALHESESKLGKSYSFWLPWDEVGGSQTEVSLICRFEPKGGPVVVSEQTRHLLPGTLRPGRMLAGHQRPKLPDGVPSRPAVQQVPYSADSANLAAAQPASFDSQTAAGVEAQPESSRRMTTTSIPLPDNFRLRSGVGTVRGGPSDGSREARPKIVLPPAPVQPPPAPLPRRYGMSSPATLARPALPFTSPSPQVQIATVPGVATLGPAAQQVPASGLYVTSQNATTAPALPPVGGVTTKVSYRFPGQPAASPQPWEPSSGSPPQSLPAQAAPGYPAPTAAIR